jgi:outer membrane protein assembly factor BamB
MVGNIVAVDTTDGSLLWSVALTDPEAAGGGFGFGCAPGATTIAIYGTPAVSENLTYVGGYNGKLYAYVFERNEWKWIYPRDGHIGSIVGGPVIAQNKVYFSAADGRVYALETEGLFEVWIFETGDKI